MPAPKDPVKRELWLSRLRGKPSPKKGIPVSEEQKRKQREAMKGKYDGERNPMFGVRLTGEQNHMFGKSHTEDTKQRISKSRKGKCTGKDNPNYQKAIVPKGSHRSVEERVSISNGLSGVPKSEEHKQKLREVKLATTPTGENSIHWKGGITKLNLHIRALPRYKRACEQAMRDADYTDAFTGKRGGLLACHHKIPQNIIISMFNIKTIDEARKCDLLFDKNNILVMLSSAHDKFHNLYGDSKGIYDLTPEEIAALYQ